MFCTYLSPSPCPSMLRVVVLLSSPFGRVVEVLCEVVPEYWPELLTQAFYLDKLWVWSEYEHLLNHGVHTWDDQPLWRDQHGTGQWAWCFRTDPPAQILGKGRKVQQLVQPHAEVVSRYIFTKKLVRHVENLLHHRVLHQAVVTLDQSFTGDTVWV